MINKKLKVIGIIVLSLVILLFLGLYVVDFFNDSEGQSADILMWVIIILTFFHLVTWGNDSKAEKDEMGQQIKNKSGKISYYILTILLFVLWFIDRQISVPDLGTIFLLSAFCIGVIIFPIVQFIVSRRFMKD